MWCHLPTVFKQRHALRIAGLVAMCVALITTLLFGVVSHAAPGINQTLSFQGRLLTAGGGVVPDGHYNIQFKIYQDGSESGGGTLKWTESYINNGGTNGVEVKNGYFSVNLGSLNAFGTQVDWNQDSLWLSMNVAGSNQACTSFGGASCTADGEMLPMKRITSVPFAINSAQLGGKTASNFVQLAQGVQTDTSTNTSSIFINKTGSGNLLQLQRASTDVFTIDNYGDLYFGNDDDHVLTMAPASSGDSHNFWLQGGEGSASGGNGGSFVLQGGNGTGSSGNGGGVAIDAGTGSGSGSNGTIQIGTTNASAISVGVASGGSQTITIGNNTSTGTTTIAGGTTAIQSKDDTTITTNGTQRARFSGSGNTLYVGNADASGQASTANGFTIQGTSSTANNAQGGDVTLQAGSATNGNANGGNLTLSGGSGVGTGTNGLVVISTPTFSTTSNDANCYTGGALVASTCTVTAASINSTSAIIVGFSAAGQTANIPDPTNTTAGRIVYITAANGSSDFTLSLNGGGTGNLTSMRQNTSATLIWNGSDWTVAGASNSTTLQSAYNNTLQSAGGAELIVSSGSNTNGLTIRDSSTNPVNGTLLEVQNASAGTLFAVNSNVPQYASNAGAETAGSTATTFPSNTWSAAPAGGTVTRYNTAGDFINTGQGSVAVTTSATAGHGIKNQLSAALNANMTYNVSFTARLSSGTFTDMDVYYSADGTSTSVLCTSGKAIKTSVWTRIDCSFKAPSSSISSNNAILIRQTTGVARTFYVDNLSVTVAGNLNYATDGSVVDNTNFASNWVSAGLGTVTPTRNTSDGYDASDSAQAAISVGAANAGIRNKLSINPLTDTLYRISVYAKSVESFTDFKIRYSPTGATDTNASNYVDCVDYNTQTISTSSWTQITCYIKTTSTAATNPYVYFAETASTARTFSVDNFTMSLATNTAANVQVGGGASGGPPTLLTVDRGASAPIAENNDSLLGSMYYDTTIGKLQCYEADGWGACGSAPDNIITISPEYTNAVMHGTGVGTMTSDICSDFLNINDPTNGPQICNTNETRNFYKWTSPQSSSQDYSIYVTYQLPSTFKAFNSGSTSIKGRVDNTTNAGITYQIYKSNSSGMMPCGNSVTVASSANVWDQAVATGGSDPSTCNFAANDSIVFKITLRSMTNANAYVSDLGFTFSNR
jgi:hypothetical protein